MKRKLYQHLASRVQAIETCAKTGNSEWSRKHHKALKWLARNYLPSGSGIDSGTAIDIEACKPERLVLLTSFHHMNEHGSYDGWSGHKVIVKPSLAFELDIRITGRNRNDIKDYLAQVYGEALRQEVDDDALKEIL